MATFMFKLGTLALKTMAKPLADRFKGFVMTHPSGRQAALALARRLHRAEVTVSRRADGKVGKAFIGEMTEERGVELASKLASEGFVFTVGAGLVGLEYERNRRKDEAKKRDEAEARREAAAAAAAEREELRLVNEAQERRLAELAGRLRSVEDAVGEFSGRAAAAVDGQGVGGGGGEDGGAGAAAAAAADGGSGAVEAGRAGGGGGGEAAAAPGQQEGPASSPAPPAPAPAAAAAAG